MATVFPSIEPTSRNFTAPKWATSSLTAQNGVTTRRLWGSRPSQAQLNLTFANISDANAALILDAYNESYGPVVDLTLPAVIFNGATGSLASWLDTTATGAGMRWFFAEEPPTVESVVPGKSTVTVRLVAELRLR